MKFHTFAVIFLLPVSINSKSIGKSDKNVTKRETDTVQHDLFPDWVPFKNKHGEELGEFIQVERKKPKKRLALPMNFLLRAVAEPDNDDYYEKGQQSDSDDYFDNREWSDLNRSPGKAREPVTPKQPDVTEIDGVITVVPKRTSTRNKNDESEESKEQHAKDVKKVKNKKPKKFDEYEEDDDATEKPKSDEQAENEAKKARILASVDDLKERHAQEQKVISEKIKEEAMHKEERERDNSAAEVFDKYSHRAIGKKTEYDDYDDKYLSLNDKYRINRLTKPTPTPKLPTTTHTITSTASYKTEPVETGKLSVFRNPSVYMVYDEETTTEFPTHSVLTTKTTPKSRHSSPSPLTTKYSSKFTTPSTEDSSGSERISLVPQESELREGEPTLFFPKKRKPKKKGKSKASQTAVSLTTVHNNHSGPEDYKSSTERLPKEVNFEPVTDTSGSGTSLSSSETAPSGVDISSSGSGPSGKGSSESSEEKIETESPKETEPSEILGVRVKPPSEPLTSAGNSAPSSVSAPSALASDAAEAADTDAASSDHDSKKKGEDLKHERGGEKEHHAEYHSEHGESGKKAYSGEHKDTKTEKGHHDKEDHLGNYHDHGGFDKHHHDEKKHYGAHHHEEHGKKHAKYEESGKHSKGHSTKGSHDIHKKEEYEKKVEFFEEEGDSAEEEKHGGHHDERGYKKTGGYKKGNAHNGYQDHSKGDAGHFAKTGHNHLHKGHSSASGIDGHSKHDHQKLSKGDHESGKKWIFHHGYPPKNANLVIIDRRADQLYHGPQYYG